jgi:hypothetical protein
MEKEEILIKVLGISYWGELHSFWTILGKHLFSGDYNTSLSQGTNKNLNNIIYSFTSNSLIHCFH